MKNEKVSVPNACHLSPLRLSAMNPVFYALFLSPIRLSATGFFFQRTVLKPRDVFCDSILFLDSTVNITQMAIQKDSKGEDNRVR